MIGVLTAMFPNCSVGIFEHPTDLRPHQRDRSRSVCIKERSNCQHRMQVNTRNKKKQLFDYPKQESLLH